MGMGPREAADPSYGTGRYGKRDVAQLQSRGGSRAVGLTCLLPGVLIGIPCGLGQYTAGHWDTKHLPEYHNLHPGSLQKECNCLCQNFELSICMCASRGLFYTLFYFRRLCHFLRLRSAYKTWNCDMVNDLCWITYRATDPLSEVLFPNM